MNRITLSHVELVALQDRLRGALEHARAIDIPEVNADVAARVIELGIAQIDQWLSDSARQVRAVVATCHDPRHAEPCPHYAGRPCAACAEQCDPQFLKPEED